VIHLYFVLDVYWIVAFIVSGVVGWSIRAYYKKYKGVTDQDPQNGQNTNKENDEEDKFPI